ncbi:MAG: hypothetical protein JWR59_212, partial [Brevundimonas sp.]|nr:hypothetical protein [Brevundimonas sp.]
MPKRRLKLPSLARIRTAVSPASQAAWGFLRAMLRRRPKPPIPMQPYVNLHSVPRRITKIALPIFLGMGCLVYGFYFALTAPYLIVPFAAPIFILILLSIWALPENRHIPTKTLEFLFSGILISLILWPNYLALTMPGLPWITAERLFGFPMAAVLLVCLSASGQFRKEIGETLASVPWLRQTFALFVLMQFITLPFSKAINQSLQKALVQQIDWTSMFIIGAWVCRQPGRVQRYVNIVILLMVPIFIITMEEIQHHQVLWNGHVPSFLKVNDPVAALILASSVRGATGLYRAKATFTTPLGLGEYMGLLAPFGLHMLVGTRSLPTRVAGGTLLTAAFVAIRLADARLGVVGMFVSTILYGLYWGLQRFRRNGRDLIAATFVYAYPAIFGVATAGVMLFKPLHRLVFGGEETAGSNEAR